MVSASSRSASSTCRAKRQASLTSSSDSAPNPEPAGAADRSRPKPRPACRPGRSPAPAREDDCLGSALFGKAMELCQCAQIEVVSGEVRGRLAAGALDLGLAQLWFDRAGDIGRNLILQLE